MTLPSRWHCSLAIAAERSDMASLVLDARALSTGLGTYTLNLIGELTEHTDIPLRLLTLPQYRERLSHYHCELIIVDAPMYSLKEQLNIPWASRNSDVLHMPHYNAPLLRRGHCWSRSTILITSWIIPTGEV